MKTLNKIIIPLTTIFIILISIWVITIFITGSKWYYNWQFEKNDTLEELSWTTVNGEAITYTEDDLDKVITQIIDYLFDREESMQVEIDGHEFFSYQAIKHMEDVKTLYKTWSIFTLICFLLLIPCIIYLIKYKDNVKEVIYKYNVITYIAIGALLLIVLLAIIIDFDWTFTEFHHILFPDEASFNDAFFGRVSNYSVDNLNVYINNTLLVEVLDIDVFLDGAIIIIVFIVAAMTGMFFFYHNINKKSKRKEV